MNNINNIDNLTDVTEASTILNLGQFCLIQQQLEMQREMKEEMELQANKKFMEEEFNNTENNNFERNQIYFDNDFD